MEVNTPIEVGRTYAGLRRINHWRTVNGPKHSRKVLNTGADFQLIRSVTESDLEARYVIELNDGARLCVTNYAYRTGAAKDIAAAVEGRTVPPERIYFRCAPRFEVADTTTSSWQWLESTVVIGAGRRESALVVIDLWKVR